MDLDFNLEIDRITAVISELEKDKELIAIFNELDLIERLKIGIKTDLRYQREAFAENLRKDFKGSVIRNCDSIDIAINNIVITIGVRQILIPLQLRNNIIKIRYVKNADIKGFSCIRMKHHEYTVDEINDIKEEIKNFENSLRKLSVFSFKKRKTTSYFLEKTKRDLKEAEVKNERAYKENAVIDEIFREDEEFIMSIKEDIELFKNNGYKFDVKLFFNFANGRGDI